MRNSVCISYSLKDRHFLGELLMRLNLLKRAGLLTQWSDQKISPGAQWDAQCLQ